MCGEGNQIPSDLSTVAEHSLIIFCFLMNWLTPPPTTVLAGNLCPSWGPIWASTPTTSSRNLMIYAVQRVRHAFSSDQRKQWHLRGSPLLFPLHSRLSLALAPLSLKKRIKEKHRLNSWHGTLLQCGGDILAADQDTRSFQGFFHSFIQNDPYQNKLPAPQTQAVAPSFTSSLPTSI